MSVNHTGWRDNSKQSCTCKCEQIRHRFVKSARFILLVSLAWSVQPWNSSPCEVKPVDSEPEASVGYPARPHLKHNHNGKKNPDKLIERGIWKSMHL